jgi:transcriptional regulator with XRE-family HTH domain
MDYRQGIRSWRMSEGLTQADLATRSGLSYAAIRAYESGARKPSAQALQAIIDAIGMPREEANRLLAGAGYAVDLYSVYNLGYQPATLEDMAAESDSLAWPAHITNQAYDVVHANRVFQKIMEIDLRSQYVGHGERNLISQVVNPAFASRMANWDEVITFMAGLAKFEPRWHSDGARQPAPWLQGAMKRLMEGDPALVERFLGIWATAQPIPWQLRHRFKLNWLYKGETLMRFTCVLGVGNFSDELHWNEWAPADAETWHALSEAMKP